MGILNIEDFNEGNEVIHKTIERDWIVDKLIRIQEEIVGYIQDGHTDPEDRCFKKFYKDIEESLKKRFGIEYKLVYNSGAMYATEITGPVTDNGLYGLRDLVRDSRKALNLIMNLTGLNEKDEQYIGFQKFQRWMEENPLEVDLDNAKFLNWPKGVVIHLHWDVVNNIKSFYLKMGVNFPLVFTTLAYKFDNVTLLDLTAPVMHEVGHVFTSITSMYQTRKNRIAFEDVVRDQQKKGVDKKRAIIYAFKQTYGKDNPGLCRSKNLTVTRVMVEVLRKEGYKYQFSGGTMSVSDGEFAADQFANRMGVGYANAKFLDAFHRKRNLMIIDVFTFGSLLLNLVMFIMGYSILSILFGALQFALALIIGHRIFFMLANGLNNTFDLNNITSIYDPDARRIQRLRLDLVRQLRLFNFDKETKERYIQELDLLQEMISGYNMWIGMGSSNIETWNGIPILNSLFSRYAPTGDYDKLEKILEETMENELHVAANRF